MLQKTVRGVISSLVGVRRKTVIIVLLHYTSTNLGRSLFRVEMFGLLDKLLTYYKTEIRYH